MNRYDYIFGSGKDREAFNVFENDNAKIVRSKIYNYDFNKKNGLFMRWGKNEQDDPIYSPIGPEIWDCECTTICSGIPVSGSKSPCAFCYKANTQHGVNLSFDNFKKMFDVFPKTLTQIAFGSDSEAKSNPDLWNMMEYCRSNGVIPNITVANIDDCVAEKLKHYCGAVAVSRYADKNFCYNSVDKLVKLGMNQINIHCMISEQTYDMCMETLHDIKNDERLSGLNAIVFLGLKKKGRARNHFDVLSIDKFENIINYCQNKNINFGFDSCSACRFEQTIKKMDLTEEKKAELIGYSESCEGYLFSFYTNCEGYTFPCSFTEDENDWSKGINMLEVKDFIKDVWFNPRVINWRNALIKSALDGCNSNCRKCLTFPEINL